MVMALDRSKTGTVSALALLAAGILFVATYGYSEYRNNRSRGAMPVMVPYDNTCCNPLPVIGRKLPNKG